MSYDTTQTLDSISANSLELCRAAYSVVEKAGISLIKQRFRGHEVTLTFNAPFSYSNRKKAEGAKERFYVGQPCSHCNNQTRYTKTGHCVPCEHEGKSSTRHKATVSEDHEQSTSKSKYELFNKLMGA